MNTSVKQSTPRARLSKLRDVSARRRRVRASAAWQDQSLDAARTAANESPDCKAPHMAWLPPAAAAAAVALSLTAAPALASDTSAAVVAPVGNQLTEGFVQGALLVFFSELGDKTFFIALLLALQRPKNEVFIGTFGALAIMTVISVGLGQVLHQLDELEFLSSTGVPWDDVLAVILLVVFGVQTLRNARNAEETAKEEKDEAKEEVAKLTATAAGTILSTFLVVFAAEWGDKSFLATIALSAASSPLGVTLGAVSAHGGASALAVVGGGYLSKNVSESTLQYGGGFLFLAFALVSALEIVQKVTVSA